MKYIACTEPDEEVMFFGEGVTAFGALMDFLHQEQFVEHCEYHEVEPGSVLSVEVYTAVEEDDENVDKEYLDLMETFGYQWVLDKRLVTHEVRFDGEKGILLQRRRRKPW